MAAPASTPRAPRWGLGDVAVGLTPFLLTGLSVLVALGSDTDEADTVAIGALVVSSIFVWTFLVGVPVFATSVKGNGVVADLGLRFRPVDGLAFVAGAALQSALPILYWPLLQLTDQTLDDVSSEARRLTDGASGAGVLVLVLIVCVGAPFAEELFFRGLTLRALDRRFGRRAAFAGTTVLFACTHFQILQLPALLLIGALATGLALRSGRLGPAILCHAGFNAWSALQLLVLDRR